MDENRPFRVSIQILVIAALLMSAGYLGFQVWQRTRPGPTLRIDPDSLSTVQGPLSQLRLYYDPDGRGKKPEVDVTTAALWTADDPNVAFVSNADSIQGQVLTRTPGSTGVSASYQNLTARGEIRVTASALEVHCEAMATKARVGEEVSWWVLFIKPGVPDYTEAWAGSEGLKASGPIIFEKYRTPGVKHAEVTVTDKAGTTVHRTCSPLEIVP